MKVGAVIVLYNPCKDLFKDVLLHTINQFDAVFIVDNSPMPYDDLDQYENITYHFIGENKGIATAQNIGIKYFEEKNYDFITFLDQDSIPSDDLIEKLLSAYKILNDQKIKIGAIGARPYNRNSNKPYANTSSRNVAITNNITEVTEIISSSSLIPVANFKVVGKMEDDLFIDGVDHEWCWRATKIAKYRFFIAEDVLLSHQLGEGDKFLLYRNVAISTPFRTYYQFRNYFRFLPRKYVPLYWKIVNGVKYLIKYFYFPLMVSPRWEYFKSINKGIFDAIFRR